MPCVCESGCVDGGALGSFGPSAVQFLTESVDPNAKIFPWSMPARYYQKPGRMVIYGTCLVAGTTRKGDTFSKDELERHGCTLIHGPVEAYTHSWDDGGNHWLSYPDNVILDAEEVDGELQYIAGIDDKSIQEAVSKKDITGVSVNTICRRVAADKPGMCQGMILNGFCLLGKDSTPASPGTSVKIWNCLRATVPLRLGGGGPCTCKTEKVVENTAQKPEDKPGQKTEDLTGHGPVAGVPEPSLEDRVKSLEQKFEGFTQYVSQQFTSLNASLGTLIAVTNSAPKTVPPAVPVASAQKTAAEWDAAFIDALPDDSFAFIDAGGKQDDQGKTAPRELRHLPFKDAQGAIDHDHLVNALARVKQGETMPEGGKQAATKKLCAAVSDWNKEHHDRQIESDVCNIVPAAKTQAVTGPVAATVPVDKLPVAPVNIKVEEIEAIVQNRALFTPVLKLNAILDLCEQKRLEVS